MDQLQPKGERFYPGEVEVGAAPLDKKDEAPVMGRPVAGKGG